MKRVLHISALASGLVFVVALGASLVCAAGPGSPDDKRGVDFDSLARDTLRGLAGVVVLAIGPGPEAEKKGLTRQQIQTDVELRLRKAGVRVLTRDELPKATGTPFLQVSVNVLAPAEVGEGAPPDLWPIAFEVSLWQGVQVESNGVRTVCATWKQTKFGMQSTEGLRTLRSDVGDVVDQFINDYLAANPPKPETTSKKSPKS